MPARKIVNEQEVERWMKEGKTHAWIIEEYRRKYNIETSSSMWSNFRRRRAIDSRLVRNEKMIPWRPILEVHRWKNPVVMLRAIARQQEGVTLDPATDKALKTWKVTLAKNDWVVHYDPDTKDGFFYVPRRPGIDKGYIREPDIS